MRYFCNICKKTITSGEFHYSMKHFGRALCRKHQKHTSHKKPVASKAAIGVGDTIKKIMHGIAYLHEAGGLGLVLVSAGIIMLISFILFKTSADVLTFVLLLAVSIVLIGVGIWISLKKRK